MGLVSPFGQSHHRAAAVQCRRGVEAGGQQEQANRWEKAAQGNPVPHHPLSSESEHQELSIRQGASRNVSQARLGDCRGLLAVSEMVPGFSRREGLGNSVVPILVWSLLIHAEH